MLVLVNVSRNGWHYLLFVFFLIANLFCCNIFLSFLLKVLKQSDRNCIGLICHKNISLCCSTNFLLNILCKKKSIYFLHFQESIDQNNLLSLFKRGAVILKTVILCPCIPISNYRTKTVMLCFLIDSNKIHETVNLFLPSSFVPLNTCYLRVV